MMQAFSLDKGFMADDDLKVNLNVQMNNGTNHDNEVENYGQKVKLCETNFSVERLLSNNNDKDTIHVDSKTLTENEESELLIDNENKENKCRFKENKLRLCEFESISNDGFQSSKTEIFDDFEGQVTKNNAPQVEVGNDFNGNDKLTFTGSNFGMNFSRCTDENTTREENHIKQSHGLKSTNLKICDRLDYYSDNSDHKSPPTSELDVSNINPKDNLMRFAEVLYKCTLCTSIPSILTSKESFVRHITEQHLTHQQSFLDCPQCSLKFQTEEDLKEHKQLTHNTGSDTTENSELHDYPDSEGLSYDIDSLDRGDDSDSHSSGHRNSNFVFTQSDDNKNVSNVEVRKDVVKASDGSLDLSLKNGHHIKRTLKPEKASKERNSNQNLPLLHQITDQIVKSSTAQSNKVPKNKSETQMPVHFTPSHTPEFGKYTKLVREGGNIVYFCQVCNWKSPVKATFSVHCGIADHKRKVIMAERSEKGNSCELDLSKLSPVRTIESNSAKKTQVSNASKSVPVNGEPVGWKPRGSASSLSLLSEPKGLFLGPKSNFIRNRNEFYPYKNLSDKVHSSQRRKKLLHSSRHQLRLKPKWSDTDSDDDDDETMEKSTFPKKTEPHEHDSHVKKIMPAALDTENSQNSFGCDLSRRENEIHVSQEKNVTIKEEIMDTITDTGPTVSVPHEVGEPSDKKPKLSPCPETSVQNLIDKHVLENIKHGKETVFKLYKCHLCVFEYSDLREYGAHFEEAHRSLSSPNGVDRENTAIKPNDRSDSGTPNAEGTSSEQLRVEKLKENLPDFVKINTKGNASRDVLLQRISSACGVSDVVSWSSACNKAMRELFPSSLAQRKGKYKKTYYFGVSLNDDPTYEEDLIGPAVMGESEALMFQPIRDLNADIEKLLEHLPTILLWTGDMDKGVYRDDILSVLADTLGNPETKNWGKQCNKAVRVVFPNVDIKRKGKDKTSVYFGVDFFNYSSVQHVQSKLAGRSQVMEVNNSGNSSPASKSQTSPVPDLGKPLNIISSWMSSVNSHKAEESKEVNSDKSVSCLKDKYLCENNFRVEEYLAKFGGVSMFDSNDEYEDNDDVKCEDSDND